MVEEGKRFPLITFRSGAPMYINYYIQCTETYITNRNTFQAQSVVQIRALHSVDTLYICNCLQCKQMVQIVLYNMFLMYFIFIGDSKVY